MAANASLMYLRKISAGTTCLYLAVSILLRSAFAAAQSLASKPRLAVVELLLPFLRLGTPSFGWESGDVSTLRGESASIGTLIVVASQVRTVRFCRAPRSNIWHRISTRSAERRNEMSNALQDI